LSSGVLVLEAVEAPQDYPERLLVARLRRKEPAAFELLVKTRKDRVYDFCVRMLGDREEAFDVTQDVFISIHAHLESFRSDATLSTWIFRIAKNHCLNRLKYLKRRGRGRSDELGEVSEQAITDALGPPRQPDELMEVARQKALIHRAVSMLEEDQRMLVALRDIEGLSYEEIMEITELPEGTVKSRLHRAREKLAGILAALEPAAEKGGR
jgi:RNA polymerase sigma-70 factor (ECF subfamily)